MSKKNAGQGQTSKLTSFFSTAAQMPRGGGGGGGKRESNSILAASSSGTYGGNSLGAFLPDKSHGSHTHHSRTGGSAVRKSISGGTSSSSSSGSSGTKRARVDHSWANGNGKAAAVDEEEELDDVTLSEAQRKVISAIMQRRSVFFTGAAGTGKSFVLRVLQNVFGYVKKTAQLSITATTGIAACNVRGMTIHSWSGLGIGTDSLEQTVARASKNQNCRKRWTECETLVIDEISMLSAEMFDMVSAIGKRCRNDPRPFGGLQVIVCGDFFQLPPVGLGNNTHFCFESNAWNELFCRRRDGMIVLDKVFRQKDSAFLRLLNELRRGHVSQATEKLLMEKVTQAPQQQRDNAKSGKPTTKLFPVNKHVDAHNLQELNKLLTGHDENGSPLNYSYRAKDLGDMNLLKGTRSMEVVELRVGAQVMLLKNISTDSGLVNGTRGRVVRFEYNDQFSAHSKVAEGLPDNLRYFPVIEFMTFQGSNANTIEFLIDNVNPSISWTTDVKNGEKVMAERTQIPLMLSWAMSIHKSQGMTIPLLEVNTAGSFEYGQTYVALSRAVDLPGLILTQFNRSSVKAHDRVRQFYQSMGVKDVAEEIDECTVQSTIAALAESFVSSLPEFVEENDGWVEAKTSSNSSSSSSSSSSSNSSGSGGGGSTWTMKSNGNNGNSLPMEELDALMDESVPVVRPQTQQPQYQQHQQARSQYQQQPQQHAGVRQPRQPQPPPIAATTSGSNSSSVYNNINGYPAVTTNTNFSTNFSSSHSAYANAKPNSNYNSNSNSNSYASSHQSFGQAPPPPYANTNTNAITPVIDLCDSPGGNPFGNISDEARRKITENREKALRRLQENRNKA